MLPAIISKCMLFMWSLQIFSDSHHNILSNHLDDFLSCNPHPIIIIIIHHHHHHHPPTLRFLSSNPSTHYLWVFLLFGEHRLTSWISGGSFCPRIWRPWKGWMPVTWPRIASPVLLGSKAGWKNRNLDDEHSWTFKFHFLIGFRLWNVELKPIHLPFCFLWGSLAWHHHWLCTGRVYLNPEANVQSSRVI